MSKRNGFSTNIGLHLSTGMTCRICGNSSNNELYHPREMMLGLREKFTYFQCSSCECLQIDLIPENLDKYYPQNYNGFSKPRKNIFSGLRGLIRKQRFFKTLFSHNQKYNVLSYLVSPVDSYNYLGNLSLDLTSKILDVGSGRGSLLYPLYQLGMKNVQGVDPFIDDTIIYSNGYRVSKGFIDSIQGEWDVIIFNHSFEHILNPLHTLKVVYKLLKKDGVCIIRTPVIPSYVWEKYGLDWFQLDAPRHFFIHSEKSLELVGNQAGLELVDIVYDSTAAQFVHSEKYKNNIAMYEDASSLYTSFLDRKLKKRRFQQKAMELNNTHKGDQAIFFLKNKGSIQVH